MKLKEDASKQDAKVDARLIKLLKPKNQGKIAQLQKKKIKVSFKKKQQSIPAAPATEKASTRKRAKATTAPKTTGEQQLPKKNKKKLSLRNPIVFQVMISSQQIKTWKAGYKGTGESLLPLLTLGLDLNHEVLEFRSVKSKILKTRKFNEAAKKAAGIDYGKWYSDKVVYA